MDKILIVDDDPIDRTLLREILSGSSMEYEMFEAESGREGLKIIEGKQKPDLVLLDIRMEGITGFDVLKELDFDKDKEHIPVLLVSAFTNEDDRLKGLDLGATDFISKPLIAEEVLARVAVQIHIKRLIENMKWVAQKTNEGIKVLYEELKRKNEELQKLDQLKSDFVSTVSHELRTPLAITTEGISLMIDEIPGEINDKQRKILSTSKDNIDRLARIIDDLLDISKIEAGKIELKLKTHDIRQVLHDFIDSYQRVVKRKDINLNLFLPESPVELNFDKDKILQIVSNLVNNAFKFTPEGGTVDVRLDPREKDVLFCVKDSGIGIDKEDMEKLFRKFQQFSRKAGPGIKGTGLGLSISRALVQLHQGDIWAESEPEQGTSFYFTIPRNIIEKEKNDG